MKNTSQWWNHVRRTVDRLTNNAKQQVTNMDANQIKSGLNSTLHSTSARLKRSMDKHYRNLPQYQSQLKTQYAKLSQQGKQLNTQFQQKFHEFSQSNPTMKHYHTKYRSSVDNLSKSIPTLQVKQSIDSTVQSTKKLGSNLQSTAKRISNTSQKAATSVSGTLKSTSDALSNVSPTKLASAASKPIHSTYKATQRLVSPSRWTRKLMQYLGNMRRAIFVYTCLGVVSLMLVNQTSYMALLYMIRHRYDPQLEFKVMGVDMTWIYKWLNVPYNADIKERRMSLQQQAESEQDGNNNADAETETRRNLEERLDYRQMQDYNINADIKLARLAYDGLLYPRIAAAVCLTVAVGMPLLRIAMWMKP